jgi:hypothetical protein
MGQAASAAAGEAIGSALGNATAEKIVTGTVAGIVSGATVAVMRGGRVNMQQIAADAFGNALGQGLVDGMSEPSEPPPVSAEERQKIIDNGPGGSSGVDVDAIAQQHNAIVAKRAMATGENMAPTVQNLRRLGMFNTDGAGALSATDRSALSILIDAGVSTDAALELAPKVAATADMTGLSVEDTFTFGGTGRFPRSAMTSSDWALRGRWGGMQTQLDAFDNAFAQTGLGADANKIAVLSAVREQLVDKLPAQIQAATRAQDREYLTRMHSAMVNGLLSTDVYFEQSIPQLMPQGYSRLSAGALPSGLSLSDPSTGYFGALYRNADNDTYIYANRGTEGPDKLDVRANVLQAFGLESAQYTQAIYVAQQLKRTFGDRLSFTGHSLGGGLASAQALATGLPAITFNSAGLNPETMRRALGSGFDSAWARGPSLVSAYYVKGDPLSQIQDGAYLPAGMGARGREIAQGMAADPTLGFSAFKWSDKDLIMPLLNGDVQSGRYTNVEPNALSSAVGTRYPLEPTAAPGWLVGRLGGVNPVPSGGALHSMATSVMYGLFGVARPK